MIHLTEVLVTSKSRKKFKDYESSFEALKLSDKIYIGWVINKREISFETYIFHGLTVEDNCFKLRYRAEEGRVDLTSVIKDMTSLNKDFDVEKTKGNAYRLIATSEEAYEREINKLTK